MREHHEYPPSSYPYYQHCACYQGEPIPSMEEEPNHPANIGTRVHAAIAAALGGPEYDCPVPLSEDEQEMTAYGVGFVQAYTGSNDLAKPEVEQRVNVVIDFDEIVFGTVDVMYPPNGEGCCSVIDHKTNRERAGSLYYPQLCVYALAAMQKYGCDRCECVLSYVRIQNGVDQGEDVWHIDRATAEAVVRGIHNDVISESMQPTPHEDACTYCAHKLTCEAVSGMALTVAKEYAAEKDLLADLADKLECYHPSKIQEPETMGVAKRVRDVLSKWCDSVDHHAKVMAMRGETIPGYSLSNPRKTEYITDIVTAYKATELSPDEFLSCCKVSVPDLRKAVAERDGIAKTGAKAKKHLQGLLGAVLEVKEGEPSLRKAKK